jgi:iron complex transport system substrate-binding protein
MNLRIFISVGLIVAAGCSTPPPRVSPKGSDETVTQFDPNTDYFPDKAEFHYARQLKVEYHRNYKVVTFRSNTSSDVVTYVLVQRGTPAPPVMDRHTRVIQVPVQRLSLGSYRYGGAVGLLGVADRLVIVAGRFITTPAIRKLIDAHAVAENYSTELVMDRESDAVALYYSNNGQSLEELKYSDLGLQTVLMAEHNEDTPLAKSEWLKFFAMLFNRERQAETYFQKIAAEYEHLAEHVRRQLSSGMKKPRVLVNFFTGDQWNVYGGRNTFVRLINDAGGEYFWPDNAESSASILPVAYEGGYDRAVECDYWIVGPDFSTGLTSGSLRLDSRLLNLPVVRNKHFYVSFNPDKNGRNPYWDQALIYPHEELADYVKVLHPELVPEHEFRFLHSLVR